MKKIINIILLSILSLSLIYATLISENINNNPISEIIIYLSFILLIFINYKWKKDKSK